MRSMAIIPILSAILGCGNVQRIKFCEMNIDRIQYSYQDESLPPPYHRSYTVVITDSLLQVTVDSYGIIISDSTFSCTKEKLGNIIQLLDSGKVRNRKEKENDGCTGGNGESIFCKSRGKMVFSGNIEHCGGKDFGNMQGELSPAVEALLALIPDFKRLLKRGETPQQKSN